MYGVYVTHHIFVEHRPGVSIIDHFENSKTLLQRTNLWRGP